MAEEFRLRSTALRTNMIKAVIFDMDGVLIDTAEILHTAWDGHHKRDGVRDPKRSLFIHAKPELEIFQTDAVRKIRCGF